MLGGADNPNGELLSYIIGADNVSSRKAGDHLLKDIRAFVESKLKQKVNEKKSAVARPWERKLWADSDGPCCFTKRLGRQAELGSLRT